MMFRRKQDDTEDSKPGDAEHAPAAVEDLQHGAGGAAGARAPPRPPRRA